MEQPVDIIREFSRATLNVSRRAQRDDETDNRRRINESVTSAGIADIAKQLKNKTAVSTADLQTLKNGVLDNPDNVEVVLNTQGALRGLVRELTGHDAQRALHAAGCICNLCLGDGRACAAVSRSAGTYLIAALSSLHTEMAATCAWAIGNAVGGGASAASLLTSQGAVTALSALMTSHEQMATLHERDVSDAAATALSHLARQAEDNFRKEHASPILQALSQTRLTQPSLRLLFILSCREDFNELINEELLNKLLEHSTTCMEQVADNLEFVYSIRTLANIALNDQVYSVILSHFSMKVDVLRKLLLNDDVAKSLLWFLGNLFNHHCDHKFFHSLLC